MADADDNMISYPARYFAAWNSRDIDVALRIVTTDVVWSDPSLPAPLAGSEQARAFFESVWAAFPNLTFEMIGPPLVDFESRRVAHEWVMRGKDSGTGFPPGREATGNSFEIYGTDVWVVDSEGAAQSVTAYYDAGSFARQLGLN
jgi:steroid delta-isomerase-like uncharacterized protein